MRVQRLEAIERDEESRARPFRRLAMGVVAVVVTALLGATITAPAAQADTVPTDPALPATVSADPLPTTQINGIVWAQAVGGTKVYAGGQFTSARPAGAPAGTNETPRSNLLAYDLATGVLDTSFAPQVNGRILAAAVSPDGSRLYIGGGFTAVNGQNRYRLAAFDTATGQLIGNWTPGTNTIVQGIVATDTTVYVTGEFSNINNTARTGVAAVSASTGAVLDFNPVLAGGYGVRSVVVSPDASKVVIAGSFTSTNGSTNPGRGMAALDASSGASLPWAINSVIRNAGTGASIYSLASDGDSVYGSGYDFGGSKTEDDFEGAFRARWSDGSMVWMEDCHGDTYSVYPTGGVLYTAAHSHYCGNIGEFPQLDPWSFNFSLAFDKNPSDRTITPDIYGYRSFTGNPAARLLHWYPTWQPGTVSGMNQAAWSVTGGGDYLVYGGEFTAVSGSAQQGLVRFAKPGTAPNKIGPTIKGGAYQISAQSFRAGQARVAWSANYDADNARLTYEVFRRDLAQPIHTTTADSTYWVRPRLTYSDTAVTAGQTYEYRVKVTDPNGNTTTSDWTPVTIAAAGTSNTYNEAVLSSSPRYYWPMNEASGSSATDWISGNDLTLSGGTTRGQAGQVVGETSASTAFNGTDGTSASSVSEVGPDEFSIEAWFQTTSTSGGKIVGFGNNAKGLSGSYDRHLYLSNSGQVTFGVYPGTARTLTSGAGLNDGKWHHVVGTMNSSGMVLYVDGVRVSSRSDTTTGQSYSGYWRIGGDSQSGWPSAGSSNYLNARIADVAVYGSALTRDAVDAHWVASGRTSSLPAAPADAYGKAVYDLDPTLYWRLGETSGTVAKDSGRDGSTGTYQTSGSATIQRGQTGALSGVADQAIRFTSSKLFSSWNNRQTVVSARQYPSPNTYSIETWFKTTSTGGGKLIGFGNSNSNNANPSSNYDRHIYMNGSGQLKFGVYNGGSYVLTAPGTYRDGQWHHVVAQQSAAGMQLFVDGVEVASNAQAGADNYNGYWRVGGDTTWEGDPFWVGTIDEAAVYSAPLTVSQVLQHYQLGDTGELNQLPTAQFTAATSDRSVAFDASASSDPEGPIAGYAWDFGDGHTGTGVAPTHEYDTAGTYTVTLTVTDAGGLASTVAHDVTTRNPNVPPTAAFTEKVEFLSVAVDASASADTDGTITAYAWNFGDGASATGATATHDYAASGTYTVSLTVTDDRGASSTETKTIAVEAQNVPPKAVANVVRAADGMSISADGSGSTDTDGSIVSHAWDFGDSTTATGATATHTYTTAGTYTVTLTVTDDDGATHQATASVAVAPAATEEVIARDAFERTASSSWGSADVGGAWTVSGGAAAFSAGDGVGRISLSPAATREARLAGVSSTSTITSLTIASSNATNGGAFNLTVNGRQVGNDVYSGRVKIEASGAIRLYLLRNETAIGNSVVIPGTYVAGEKLSAVLTVRGTSPTTLALKVWRTGTTEPANPQLQGTDSTAALQTAGAVGVKMAISSVSSVSSVFSVDDYKVVTGAVVAAPNQIPTASFVSSTSALSAAVDAGGSSDADGTIASYAWTFGDGGTATGVTASHTYAASGTYDVTLTVTDDDGGTHSVTKPVTVTAPVTPPDPTGPTPLATDEFDRATTGGWGSADLGGAWTLSGGNAAFSTAGGKGVVSLAPSQTREARLAVTGTSTVLDALFSSDVASTGGTASITLLGRTVGASTYSARVRLEPAGVIRLYLLRNETAIGNSYVLPGSYAPGQVLHARLAVSGTAPTSLAAKVWVEGQTEPADWQLTGTDAVAAMQVAGGIGIKTSVSSASTNTTTRLSFERFAVVVPQ
ncbi:PKD domain-containing protein [Microbacterium sp. HSID17254]|jgi:PKD repeat protein|nr:PKD domain-containing protein [Microbacterium paraoxydans]RUQ06734.1 PKD domain-containing protein [Microbacterium sp. HSID17254]